MNQQPFGPACKPSTDRPQVPYRAIAGIRNLEVAPKRPGSRSIVKHKVAPVGGPSALQLFSTNCGDAKLERALSPSSNYKSTGNWTRTTRSSVESTKRSWAILHTLHKNRRKHDIMARHQWPRPSHRSSHSSTAECGRGYHKTGASAGKPRETAKDRTHSHWHKSTQHLHLSEARNRLRTESTANKDLAHGPRKLEAIVACTSTYRTSTRTGTPLLLPFHGAPDNPANGFL